MNRVPLDAWARLEVARPSGEELMARAAIPEQTNRLIAAVDSTLKRHLLIRLEGEEQGCRDEKSRGLRVATREMSLTGSAPAIYIDITCDDPAGHQAFDLIAFELAERLAAGREAAPVCVSQVLTKWRRFWGQAPQQLLSWEVQLGLFAEIWFLSVWLIPRVGPIEAIRRWRGPFGARHDFEWSGRSIEVKATTSTRGLVHRIHGIEQLMKPTNGDLFLFSLRLREEGGATNSLPALVASCRNQLQMDDAALDRYESALANIGYVQIHEDDYRKRNLRVVNQCLFGIKDDFPRLVPENLRAGVPAGIQYVEYEINLSGFERLQVANDPTQFTDVSA